MHLSEWSSIHIYVYRHTDVDPPILSHPYWPYLTLVYMPLNYSENCSMQSYPKSAYCWCVPQYTIAISRVSLQTILCGHLEINIIKDNVWQDVPRSAFSWPINALLPPTGKKVSWTGPLAQPWNKGTGALTHLDSCTIEENVQQL